MGYSWAANTDTRVPFDGFMYRGSAMVAVRMMKTRYSPGEDCDIERIYPEIVREVRLLPIPPYVRRELWLRTQNERAYRRFLILPETTAEIEENTAEHYRNPHYNEGYWEKSPVSGRHPPGNRAGGGEHARRYPAGPGAPKERQSENPVICPDWQTDEGHFFVEWKSCPRRWRKRTHALIFGKETILTPLQPAK